MAASEVSRIPLFYRIVLLWWEPFLTFTGTITALFAPEKFLSGLTGAAPYDPRYQIPLDHLAALYTALGLNEAFVLRITSEIKVWKAVQLAMLGCDTVHIYTTILAWGIPLFFRPARWRSEDQFVFANLMFLILVRFAFVFEIGFPRTSKKAKTR